LPKSLLTATAVGILLGIALVWWAAPQTSSGAVFLIVACVLICNLLGAVVSALASWFAKPGAPVKGEKSP
jgi:hypothetical protein